MVIEAEYIDTGVVMITRPLLSTVQNNEIIFSYSMYKVDILAGVLSCHYFQVDRSSI